MILDLLNYLLFGTAAVLLLWFFWGWINGNDRQNKAWMIARKQGKINAALVKIFRKYPDKERFFLIWLQLNNLKKALPGEGVLAELGVYRAETAAVIHAIAPERELWLFDTLEGFRNEDLINETGIAKAYDTSSFADTSEALILEKLGNAANVKLFKGDFAEISASLPEKVFAFVNIDADLATPTLAGLQYFYPRLLPGGVIIVHDFNLQWPALMQAVEQFLTQIPENAVLIPDRDNSLVIVKNKATGKGNV